MHAAADLAAAVTDWPTGGMTLPEWPAGPRCSCAPSVLLFSSHEALAAALDVDAEDGPYDRMWDSQRRPTSVLPLQSEVGAATNLPVGDSEW